ncbi:MAG: GHKL domain-containing protein [Lachnospiraceae bacterium]|nr:GHKL domain-containing protein [Lachnospiraceae bacterium]
MNWQDFLESFLSYFIIIPGAVLCILPMKDQFVCSLKKTILISVLFLVSLIAITSFIDINYKFSYNDPILIIAVILSFIAFSLVCKTAIHKRLNVFFLSCVIISFIANITNYFDAMIHPSSNIDNLSFEAIIFQVILSVVVTALLAFPLYKYGSRLINSFESPKIWYAGAGISVLCLAINFLMIPGDYESINANNNILFNFISLLLLFILYLILIIMYYYLVKTIKVSDEDGFKDQLIKMQENVYTKQTQYLVETSRQRHDFKNLIKTFDMLVQNNRYEELKLYIREYADALPENTSKLFTLNTPVNAILNHYMTEAKENDIKLSWEVDIPSVIPIANLDVCAIIGNILENAILACKEVAQGEPRFIDLSITYENETAIYISATNSFDSSSVLADSQLLNGSKETKGLGLASISSIASKYHGSANFSHEKNEFYSEIMLRNPDKTNTDKK